MGAIAEYRKKEADYLSRYVDCCRLLNLAFYKYSHPSLVDLAYSVSELDVVTEERNKARKFHEDLLSDAT
jgi:hypothetical protein